MRKQAKPKLAVKGTGIGIWKPLNEDARHYFFMDGSVLTILNPVRMRYTKSGHDIETASGEKHHIYTNHSDCGRQNLKHLKIDSDEWPKI